jgi:hypothetical protein
VNHIRKRGNYSIPLVQTRTGTQTFNVIDSSSFVLPQGGKEADIKFADLAFTLSFDNDPKHTAPSVDGSGNGKTLTLNFKGFAGVLPVAFQSQVGHVNGKPLWIAISISTIGDQIPTAHRLISYTFYAEA